MHENENVESTRHETRIPAEAFGGTVPDDDRLRFYRLIEERGPVIENEVQWAELACGHRLLFLPALPAKQEYAYCEKCRVRFGCK